MSDSTLSNSEIEAKAAALLRQQDFERWTERDQIHCVEWIAESPRHRAAYWRLKAAWDQSERLAVLRPKPLHRREPYRGTTISVPAKVFAAAIVVVALSSAAWLWSAPAGQLYTTGVGGRTIIKLADGSELDVGTDTTIRTNFDANQRTVEVLKGEVFFHISHDQNQPFVVFVAGHRVIDLGTEFMVRASSTTLEVALVRGEAKVEATGLWHTSHSAILHPGDVALATSSSLDVTRKSDRELSDELAWRRGALVFHNTRLDDAVAEFNRYNETKLSVSNAKIGGLTINGTFRTNGFEQFARVTRDVFGLHVERRERDVVLKK